MSKKAKETKEKQEEIDTNDEIEYSEDPSIASTDTETMVDMEAVEDEMEFSTGKDFQDKFKKLKDELKQCKKERQEHLDGWQRARADYANLKTEEDKKRAQITEFTKEELLLSFLPVLDSFDMAFANKEVWEKVDKNWKIGVENIYNQFLSVIKDNGVLEISETGVLFDPGFHQHFCPQR